MLERLLGLFADHAAMTTSTASAVATGTLAMAQVPSPSGLPSWAPYLMTTIGPVLIFLIQKAAAIRAKRNRALAAAKQRRAFFLAHDNKPENDAESRRLADEADELLAEADALAILKKGSDD